MIPIQQPQLAHRFLVEFTDNKFSILHDDLSMNSVSIIYDTIKLKGTLLMRCNVDIVELIDDYFKKDNIVFIVNTTDGKTTESTSITMLYGVIVDSIIFSYDYRDNTILELPITFSFSDYHIIT